MQHVFYKVEGSDVFQSLLYYTSIDLIDHENKSYSCKEIQQSREDEIMKYRKKPVCIDAIKWLGDNIYELNQFMGREGYYIRNDQLYIETLEGTLHAGIGDYIIRGIKGEYYPCKPDIFYETYEPVDDKSDIEPDSNHKPIVPLNIIVDAIEMANDEWNQYLDIEKMEVVSLPEYPFGGEYDEEDQELADLIDEEWNKRFFPLPSQYDIHEYSIMERFIWDLPNERVQEGLASAIRGKGAFRRFKDRLYQYGLEQAWYQYQERAYRNIAIEWCEEHGFRYSERAGDN